MGIYDFDLTAALSANEDESPSASNLEGALIQKQEQQAGRIGISRLLPVRRQGRGFLGQLPPRDQQPVLLDQSFVRLRARPLLRPAAAAQLRPRRHGDRHPARRARQQHRARGVRRARGDDDRQRRERLLEPGRGALPAARGRGEPRHRAPAPREQPSAGRRRHAGAARAGVERGRASPPATRRSSAPARPSATRRTSCATCSISTTARVWTLPLVPETDANTEFAEVSLEQSLADALAGRPELARQRLAVESRQATADFEHDQTKPRLDLVASYGWNGVGGDVLLRDDDGDVIATLPGGWDDAIDQVTDRDFPGWSVGVEFGYPLGNRTARARAVIGRPGARAGARQRGGSPPEGRGGGTGRRARAPDDAAADRVGARPR